MDKSNIISQAGWVGRPVKKAAPACCVSIQARRRAHDMDHGYYATVSSNIKNVTSSIPQSQISLSQTRPLPKDDFMFGCPSCNRSFDTHRGLKVHQAHCENLLLFSCNQGSCKRRFNSKASRTKHMKKCPHRPTQPPPPFPAPSTEKGSSSTSCEPASPKDNERKDIGTPTNRGKTKIPFLATYLIRRAKIMTGNSPQVMVFMMFFLSVRRYTHTLHSPHRRRLHLSHLASHHACLFHLSLLNLPLSIMFSHLITLLHIVGCLTFP